LLYLDPSKRRQFKQFINTDERLPSSEMITERGQRRPADWAKSYPPIKLSSDQVTTPKAEWTWFNVAKKSDLVVSGEGTSSAAIKYGDTQLAVYHVPRRGYYATQQMYV
jgi:nitrite reductase (NAD(P)H)